MDVLDRWLRRRRSSPVVAPVAPAPEAFSPEPVPQPPPVPRTRHGSQRRQRTHVITVHVTPDEHAALVAKATEAGLSAGGFGRLCMLGAPTPRTKTRATFTDARHAEMITALNRTGNNLNQIARAFNRGDAVAPDELRAAIRHYEDALLLLMAVAPGAANDH